MTDTAPDRDKHEFPPSHLVPSGTVNQLVLGGFLEAQFAEPILKALGRARTLGNKELGPGPYECASWILWGGSMSFSPSHVGLLVGGMKQDLGTVFEKAIRGYFDKYQEATVIKLLIPKGETQEQELYIFLTDERRRLHFRNGKTYIHAANA